ncbi:MAG: site-2 protease family protein [Patescibacteria group bacterium]|nr:site-2 protease family protein [Patescibacteria group bacterium]
MRPFDAEQPDLQDPFPGPYAPILAEVVSEPASQWPAAGRPGRRWVALPLFLFVATCLSTLLAGGGDLGLTVAKTDGLTAGLWAGVAQGMKLALPLMTILIFHEMGHFLQARRYGVYASFPFFIPMPLSPLGTLGAVIAMEPRIGDRKALFDIGITGPLAGLLPTLIFCVVGLHWSEYGVPKPNQMVFGDPLLFQWLTEWVLGPRPAGHDVMVHPMAFAAWAGLLVTSLNLIPIGQLDGGHILYSLLRKWAYPVAALLLAVAAGLMMVNFALYGSWLLMLLLLIALGPKHPPTRNDHVRLGPVRILLGWLALAFILIGFTPQPIISMG